MNGKLNGSHIFHQNKTHPLVQVILQYAARHDVDSMEMAFALADALAVAAATLDLYGPPESRCTLNERIDVFVERVRVRHPEIIADMLLSKAAKQN